MLYNRALSALSILRKLCAFRHNNPASLAPLIQSVISYQSWALTPLRPIR
jgi:hypothetical protein